MDRFKDDKYRGAVSDFNKAINIRPKYTVAHIGRGNARIGLGQYEEAIADFDQAIRLQPHKAYTFYIRGRAKSSIGQYKEAIADWQASLELADEANDTDLITSIERRIQEFERK